MGSPIRIILSALFLLQFLCAGGAWGLGVTSCPLTAVQPSASNCQHETMAATSLQTYQPRCCCCDSGIQPCRVKREKVIATSPSILPAQPRVMALYRAPLDLEQARLGGNGGAAVPFLQTPIQEDPLYILTRVFLI